MTRILALAFALVASVASAQTFSPGQPAVAEWVVLTATEIADFHPVRYELSIDGIALPNIPFTPTLAAFTIPASLMTYGPHTATLRICNADDCSPWSNMVTFSYKAIVPTAPRLTIKPPPVVLGAQLMLPQQLELAHSYQYVLRLRRLTDAELTDLAYNYHGDGSHASILSYLDERAK